MATVQLAPIRVGFELVSTSQALTGAVLGASTSLPDLSVGETFLARFTLILPRLLFPGTVVFEAGSVNRPFEIITAFVESVGAAVVQAPAVLSNFTSKGALDSVSFDLGTIRTDSGGASAASTQQVSLLVEGVARDLPGVTALGQSAALQGKVMQNGTQADLDSISFDFVEPDLQFASSIVSGDPLDAQAGSMFTLGVNMTHTPSSRGPAYELVVTDDSLVGSGRQLDLISVTVDGVDTTAAVSGTVTSTGIIAVFSTFALDVLDAVQVEYSV